MRSASVSEAKNNLSALLHESTTAEMERVLLADPAVVTWWALASSVRR